MTETTAAILAALADSAKGRPRPIALDPGLYPLAALRAAAEAFAETARVTLLADSDVYAVVIETLPQSPGGATAVVGALLNFALVHALDGRVGAARA